MTFFESIKRRAIMWVWNHTPNCAEMSRLASRSLEQMVAPAHPVQDAAPLSICVWCKRYFKQLEFLHPAAPQSEDYAGNLPGSGLSAEARQRIMLRLQLAAK
jgi:hypothetical protein